MFDTKYRNLILYRWPKQMVVPFLIYLLFVLRAPVLVALALIECGMEYEDAVHFIRLWAQNTVLTTALSIILIFTNSPLIFLNIVSCFEHTVSFMLAGSAVERSTPSSCSTWKTTKLNCVCAPKMPTDRAAAYSRNLRPPVHLHCSFTGDFHLLKLKGILVTLKQMEIIQNTSCISKY